MMNIIPLNNNKESKDILLKNLDIDKTLVLILEQKNVVSLLDLLELNNKKILELVNFNEQYFLEVAAIINQEINTKRNYDLTRKKRLNINPHFLRKVSEIDWTVRTANCLKNSNIVYIGDLIEKTESYLLRTPNFGRKSLREVRNVLKEMNLSLGMNLGEDWPPENIEEYKKHYQLDSLDVASAKYVPINQIETNTQTQPVTVKKKLEEAGIYDDAIAILNKALETLSEREQDVIKKRYQEKLTLEEVGKTYQVTRERIRQIQAKSLRKLKHPSRRFYFERINVLNEEHIWNALADGKNYIASQTINHPEYHPNLNYDTRISMEVCGGINNYLNNHYTQFDHGWIKGEINFDIKEINSYVDQIKQLLKEISYPIHENSVRDTLKVPKNIFDICLDLSCSIKYKKYILDTSGSKSKKAIDIYEFMASHFGDQLVHIEKITNSCRLQFNNFIKGSRIYQRYIMHLMQSYPHLFYRQYDYWRILFFNPNIIISNKQSANQNQNLDDSTVIEINKYKLDKKEQLYEGIKEIDTDLPKFNTPDQVSYEERLKLVKDRYENAYKVWTNKDLDYLKELYENGRTIVEISAMLKRQPSAIIERLDRLGLLENDNENGNGNELKENKEFSIPLSRASRYVYEILLEQGPLKISKVCDEYIKKANLNCQTYQVYKIVNLIINQSEGMIKLAPSYWGLNEHRSIFSQSNTIKLDEKTFMNLSNSFCDERFCKNYILHKYGESDHLFIAYNHTTEMLLNHWAEQNDVQDIRDALLYVSSPDQWPFVQDKLNNEMKDQWIEKKSTLIHFNMKSSLGSIKLKGFEPDLETLFRLLIFIKEHQFINYAIADGLIYKNKHNYQCDKSHLVAAYLGYAVALDSLEINNDWMKKIPAGNRITQLTNIFTAQKYLNGYLNWENENFQFLKENINEVLDKNLLRSSWFESDFFHLL